MAADDFIQRQRAASFGAINFTRDLGTQNESPATTNPTGFDPSAPFKNFSPSSTAQPNTNRPTNVSVNQAITAADIAKERAKLVISEKDLIKRELRKNNIPNPLEEFASYNVLWTLACLTPQQYNNPALYRGDASQLQYVIFSSGGRFDSKRVRTSYGTPEFFINNFQMKCIVAGNTKTGNQNAIGFSFEIFEPYSMGLLLQSTQRAARLAGFENYLDNAPFVLRMDFQGYDELGNIYKAVQPKFFTMKITKMHFQVNESGSTYKVDAIPYNHQAFSNMTNTVYKDCKIQGDPKGPGTVEELLITSKKSLVKYLNNMEKTLVEKKLIEEPDVYEIQFPEQSNIMYSTSGAPPQNNRATVAVDATEATNRAIISAITKNANISAPGPVSEIGSSSLGFTQRDGGTIGFKRANEIYDAKTGIKRVDNMFFNAKDRVFQFAQDHSLTAIINQVILSSEWAKNTIKKTTPEGYIKWFKVDIQVEFLKFDYLIGDYAKKFILRIVPYYIHQSIFAEVTQKPIGYDQLYEKVIKFYDYIYTGQNVDVLKFDIDIKNLFYKGAHTGAAQDNAKADNPEQAGVSTNAQPKVEREKGSANEQDQEENVGRARKKRDPAFIKRMKGGSGFRSSEQEVAEEFHHAFVSGGSADMMTLKLEILGDTYWIVDSGYSNYFAKADPSSQVTADGQMNYESGDIYIYITFRTPADIDETTGLYDFKSDLKESPFGGIYRITQVENNFSEGLWKQTLNCIRMPGPQGPEVGARTAASSNETAGPKIKEQEPETSSPTDEPVPERPINTNIQVT